MVRARIAGRLLAPVKQTVVANHRHDAQPIVIEYFLPPMDLRHAMRFVLAPAGERFLIAPELQRQQLVGVGQTLKALDRNEPVDLFQVRPQRRGDVQIFLAPASGRPHFKNDTDHCLAPSFCVTATNWSSLRLAEPLPIAAWARRIPSSIDPATSAAYSAMPAL